MKILVYSGDVDAIVPVTGTMTWMANLNRTITTPKTAWYVNGQVGGRATVYDGYTFTTIRNAGHMVSGGMAPLYLCLTLLACLHVCRGKRICWRNDCVNCGAAGRCRTRSQTARCTWSPSGSRACRSKMMVTAPVDCDCVASRMFRPAARNSSVPSSERSSVLPCHPLANTLTDTPPASQLRRSLMQCPALTHTNTYTNWRTPCTATKLY